MAEQLKIAREISASCVGTRSDGAGRSAPPTPAICESASVSSWEHGLIRASRELPPGRRKERYLVGARRGGRAGH